MIRPAKAKIKMRDLETWLENERINGNVSYDEKRQQYINMALKENGFDLKKPYSTETIKDYLVFTQ
ncbi:MAG: hypothetical protein ABFD50_08070 [Smithella sp.]